MRALVRSKEAVAKLHRVGHVVYHSVFRAERFKDVPHFASKLAVEEALKAFDVPFTIIRPNYFYQNDERLKDAISGAGTYPMPLGPDGISAVDVWDVAEAAAVALTTDGHQGKTYVEAGLVRGTLGPSQSHRPPLQRGWPISPGLDLPAVRRSGAVLEQLEDAIRRTPHDLLG